MNTTFSAAKHGLADVLFLLLKSIAQRKKRKAETLRNVADEHFRGLESTHKLFIELLSSLSELPRQLKGICDYNEHKGRSLIIETILDVENVARNKETGA
jgi:hypothetical protein